jgi:hypothetical protein
MGTITSANSTFVITIPLLYPVPTQIEGYATDDAFDTTATVIAEVFKGVDGRKSAGFIPHMIEMTVHLQADSPSMFIFEDLDSAQNTAKEVYSLQGEISLPSVGRSYTLIDGTLTSIMKIASARKTLQARTFVISWSEILAQPIVV